MRFGRRSIAVGTAVLVLVGMLGLIWLPVLTHYSASASPVAPATVEHARQQPSDATLDEIGAFELLPIEYQPPSSIVTAADDILQGHLVLPNLPAADIVLPFSADDLDGLPESLQLWFAGYAAPSILLSAYQETQRDDYLETARDMILAWNEYERSARWPRGLLWNDHAVAARAGVLVRFWRLYRDHPDYRPDVGQAVMEQGSRYEGILSDPGWFTFATNHGLMQNVALLQLALAFPMLRASETAEQVAIQRTDQQLTFLVDEHGVARENSAGYQAFDLHLLAMLFRSMTLSNHPVPETWAAKYERGIEFLATLRRPDGTLPLVGDTDGASTETHIDVTNVDALGRSSPLAPWAPPQPAPGFTDHGDAGYWTYWGGLDKTAAAQTIVAFPRPPAPSHEHADEPSVLAWSDGISWLTNVGYWPYDDPGRAGAESWTASNAPHLSGESARSDRSVRILASGSTSDSAVVDLERHGPGSYVARRQVIYLAPDTWIVLDEVAGGAEESYETIWTLPANLAVSSGSANGEFRLTASNGASANLLLTGSPGMALTTLHASRNPLAGWTVVDGIPRPATAISVEQPHGTAWATLVLSAAGSNAAPLVTRGADVTLGDTPEQWSVELPSEAGRIEISRSNERVTIAKTSAAGTISHTLDLAGERVSGASSEVGAAFDRVAASYPKFQDWMGRRSMLSLLIVPLLVLQELLLWLVRRSRRELEPALRAASLVGWYALASWLSLTIIPSWIIVQIG